MGQPKQIRGTRLTRRIGGWRWSTAHSPRKERCHDASSEVFVLLCVLGAVTALGQPRDSRVHKLEELAWPDIDALDRERTMFILPIGMIEEHGPHLPVASDTFGVEDEATSVSKRASAALPQWHVVTMPTIHYGGPERTNRRRLCPPGHVWHPSLHSPIAGCGYRRARSRRTVSGGSSS